MSFPDSDCNYIRRENTEVLQSQEFADLCNASTIVNISIQKKGRKIAKKVDIEVENEEVTHDLKINEVQKVVSFFFLIHFRGIY